MDTLFIFGARYAYLLAPLIAVACFARASFSVRKQMLRLGIITASFAFIISRILNNFYSNPRPFVSDGVMPLITHAADNGFPSDHTLFVAVIAVVLAWFHKKCAAVVALLAVFVGVSRVYVGVHHTVDVLGGIGIALVAMGITGYIRRRYDARA